jgi:hypothetical protein
MAGDFCVVDLIFATRSSFKSASSNYDERPVFCMMRPTKIHVFWWTPSAMTSGVISDGLSEASEVKHQIFEAAYEVRRQAAIDYSPPPVHALDAMDA